MEYKDFVDCYKKRLEEYLHPYRVTLEEMKLDKVNQQVNALAVHVEDCPISPVFYLDSLYMQNQEGHTVSELAFKTSIDVNEAVTHAPEIYGQTEGFRKEQLYAVVVNTEKNEAMLKYVPHIDFEDLSVIPRYRLTENSSFLIRENLCCKFRMTPEEVVETAIHNTNEQGYRIERLEDVLKEFVGGIDMGESSSLYVVSNNRRMNGASAILDRSWMQQHAAELGESFYILPSSIHELLTVPESFAPSADDLKEMVQSVNSCCLEKCDILSDNVYYYNAKEKTVSIVDKVKQHVETDKTKQIENALKR